VEHVVHHNIRLIGDLVQRTDRETLSIRNIGRKTLREDPRS
jgi:DNA-directed RNA polymerase alpha subunit